MAFCPAEVENLDDMLVSHEFRLPGFADGGVNAFCVPPFTDGIFSVVEELLVKLGL